MKYALFDVDGGIVQACNDDTVNELPEGARELTDEQFLNWPAYRLVGGEIVYSPPAIASPTKQQREDAILAPHNVTRPFIQSTIIACEAYAKANGLTLAYIYERTKLYKVCKDLEALCSANDATP